MFTVGLLQLRCCSASGIGCFLGCRFVSRVSTPHSRMADMLLLGCSQPAVSCRLTALHTAFTAGHAVVEVLPSQHMGAVSLELQIYVQGKHELVAA